MKPPGRYLWSSLGLMAVLLLFACTTSLREPAGDPPATQVHPVSSTAAPRDRKPQRIMSIMLCSDLLLLMMVPKERIVSVSYLAHQAVQALMPGKDRGVPINHGTAEDILLQRPDLILAGTYSTPMARKLAKKVGANIVEIGTANNFDDIRRTVRQIGTAVGESGRAEALLAGMDEKLALLAAQRPAVPLRVVAWSGGDSVPGRGTLTDAIIRVSGAENIAAASLPAGRYGSFGLEELLQARPDAVLLGENRWSGSSLQDSDSSHALLARYWHGRQIRYPDAAFTCGLPQSADAAMALHDIYRELPAAVARW